MADVTPETAMASTKCVVTWGSNTYHGITNWRRSGSAESTTIKVSSSTGAKQIRIAGGTDASITVDILVAEGDATTPAAFKEGTEQTTCTLHPEGDTAGNLEILFDDGGVVLNNDMGGRPGEAMIMSVTIGALGDDTMADAT